MVWTSAAIAVLGLAVGLRFKAPALIAGSGLILLSAAAAGLWTGWPVLTALAVAAGLMILFQACYIVGLVLSRASRRRS